MSSFFFNTTLRFSSWVGFTVDPVRVPGVPDSARVAGVAGVPDDDDDDDELVLSLSLKRRRKKISVAELSRECSRSDPKMTRGG